MDLATAIGSRKNRSTGLTDLFLPQLLYTLKLGGGFALGGSFVNIVSDQETIEDDIPVAIDIFLLVPLRKLISLPPGVSDLNLALGLFNPVTNTSLEKDQFIPTYSLDIKFSWP